MLLLQLKDFGLIITLIRVIMSVNCFFKLSVSYGVSIGGIILVLQYTPLMLIWANFDILEQLFTIP